MSPGKFPSGHSDASPGGKAKEDWVVLGKANSSAQVLNFTRKILQARLLEPNGAVPKVFPKVVLQIVARADPLRQEHG